MKAPTTLLTSLKASDRPIDTEMPAVPPSEAATDAAPAIALMPEESIASMLTLPALMPSVSVLAPSPLMDAWTRVLILFSV